MKLRWRYDPDQYRAGQHLKVTLSHNAEQTTEEQGEGKTRKKEERTISWKIRTTRRPDRIRQWIREQVALFHAVKQLCFNKTRKNRRPPEMSKNTQLGTESKGKASSQRDPQAQHSSYLSSAALCGKVLALLQHTRRCHCRPKEPYASNLAANPCSEQPC